MDWDANHPDSYRRILLVEPTGTAAEPSFQDIGIHVGGIAWYEDLLYVADSTASPNGMRVFDMSKIVTTDTGGSKDQIGRDGNSFYAHELRLCAAAGRDYQLRGRRRHDRSSCGPRSPWIA